MSFTRPTLSQLVEQTADDINARLPGADSRLRRSVLAVLARVHAGAVDLLYRALTYLSRQLMPDTADAEELQRWASIWGVTRKAAVAARGVVTLQGVEGAIVPIGTVLIRSDGARYQSTAAAVIAGKTAQLQIEAVEAGADSVVSAGATLTFASPVSGVVATAVAAAGIGGGAQEEGDAELRARLLSRIRTPPQGGSASDWKSWALEIAGVTRAWVFPDWTGAGTVGLTFVHDGRDDVLPQEADLVAMRAHIDALRPVTATAVVFAPTAYLVRPLIAVTPDTPAVRAAIAAELADLFRREAEPGGVLLLSRMNEAISLAAGEYDHELLSPAANVVAPPGYLPVLAGPRWA